MLDYIVQSIIEYINNYTVHVTLYVLLPIWTSMMQQWGNIQNLLIEKYVSGTTLNSAVYTYIWFTASYVLTGSRMLMRKR